MMQPGEKPVNCLIPEIFENFLPGMIAVLKKLKLK